MGKAISQYGIDRRAAIWTSTKAETAVENAFRHFGDHGADFCVKNAADYVKQARNFLHNPPPGTLTKIRQSNGDIIRYNPKSNTFGIMDAKGAPRTFYKPAPRSPTNLNGYDPKYNSPLEYFNDQK